jgi:hypothetical protein
MAFSSEELAHIHATVGALVRRRQPPPELLPHCSSEVVPLLLTRSSPSEWRPLGWHERRQSRAAGMMRAPGSWLVGPAAPSGVGSAEGGPVDPDRVAVVTESVEEGADLLLVSEETVPLLVVEVGGDDGGLLVVAVLHELEEDVGLLGPRWPSLAPWPWHPRAPRSERVDRPAPRARPRPSRAWRGRRPASRPCSSTPRWSLACVRRSRRSKAWRTASMRA